MALVPSELWQAIRQASANSGVPTWVLVGIWVRETGGKFPNPYVNSSGYGGLFGTTHWNTSTQDQADYAASIIGRLYRQYGNWPQAFYHYSGGGYTSVPTASTPATQTVAGPQDPHVYSRASYWAETLWASGVRDAQQMYDSIVAHLKSEFPTTNIVLIDSAASWATALEPTRHPDTSVGNWFFNHTAIGGTISEASGKVMSVADFLAALASPNLWQRVLYLGVGLAIGFFALRMIGRETGITVKGVT